MRYIRLGGNMDLSEVLSRAWRIIWKHKVLWIFGILAGCGQGGGGGGGGGGGNTGFNFSEGDPSVPPDVQRFFFEIERFFQQIEAWEIAGFIALIILVVLIIWLIALVLGTIGRLGLIQGTVLADDDADRLTFRELFDNGKPFFWRVLGLNVLVGLAIFLLILIMIIPIIVITTLTFGVALFCLIPLICLLVPVSWAISIVMEQANNALVLEDLDIITAIKRGWAVFRENLGQMAVMFLILGIGGAIAGFIFALPIFLIIVPLILGAILGGVTETQFAFGGGLTMTIICLVGYLPVLIVLGGVLRAYIQTAWTLTYRRLTQPSEVSDEELDELPAKA